MLSNGLLRLPIMILEKGFWPKTSRKKQLKSVLKIPRLFLGIHQLLQGKGEAGKGGGGGGGGGNAPRRRFISTILRLRRNLLYSDVSSLGEANLSYLSPVLITIFFGVNNSNNSL